MDAEPDEEIAQFGELERPVAVFVEPPTIVKRVTALNTQGKQTQFQCQKTPATRAKVVWTSPAICVTTPTPAVPARPVVGTTSNFERESE